MNRFLLEVLLMKNKIDRILNTGIRSEQLPRLAKRIRLTNKYSVIFALSALFYSGIFLLLGMTLLSQFTIGVLVLFLSSLYLNRVGAFKLSRLLLMLNAVMVVYSYSTILGQQSGVHFWFFAAAQLVFILFDLEERYYQVSLLLLVLAAFLFLDFTNFSISPFQAMPLSAIKAKILFSTMLTLSFLVSFSMIYSIILDYSAVSKMFTQAQQMAELLRKALDTACIVTFSDASGRIVYANDKFAEISGCSKAETLGQPHSIVNLGYHPKEFFQDLWQTIAKGRVWRGEICNKAKDGRLYWVDTTIVPVVRAKKDALDTHYVSVRQDITGCKDAEVSMIHASKMATLGEMAGGIAHEINKIGRAHV